MRIFEMTAHVKKINRDRGRTATAAAAYRACALIECEFGDRTHDYRRKQGIEASEIHIPASAPAWASNRSALWNAAEMRERNGKRGRNAGAFKADAVTAREIMFGFPAELSTAGRLEVARDIARHLVEAHGVAVDFSIHKPGKQGDERNHHCHLMMTTRRMTADGLTEKAREWDGRREGVQTITGLRAFLAGTMNAALAREGLTDVVHVEHRSHQDRGTGITPTRHQGPGKTLALRKHQTRERTAWERTERSHLKERHNRDLAALKRQHEIGMAAKQKDLADREQKAIAAIRAEHEAKRPEGTPAKGIARLWDIATGQAAKTAADREAQAADREQKIEGRIADIRAELQAERTAYAAGQAKEQKTVAERHHAEAHQMARAVSGRTDNDRHAEVDMRRDQVNQHSHDRQHERLHQRGHERTINPD